MIARRRLFWKYVVVLVALVVGAVLASGAIDIYFASREIQAAIAAVQKEKAVTAATRIEAFVREIERQMAWVTQPPLVPAAAAIEQRRLDYFRLQRQVPAITETAYLDASGKEQLRVSRLAINVVGSQADLSGEPKFREARTQTWFGPVYFRQESEPYMTIAMPHARQSGVTVAEVNLKFIWDVISPIRIGTSGHAFAIDTEGRLIAHRDISLVLQKTSFADLPQVRAALAAGTEAGGPGPAYDRQGHAMLAAHSVIPSLRWVVFVEQPRAEALAPVWASVRRAVVLVLIGVALSVVVSLLLARRMVRPIRALQEGATRIGAGELGHRIDVRTGDEFEALAARFNEMTGRLSESYATLEQRVDERTRELTEALEQQTATSDILRVISRTPTDMQPVFEAITVSAVRLSGADLGHILRVADGQLVPVALTPAESSDVALEVVRRNYPRPVDTTSLIGRSLVERRVIHVPDLEDPASPPRLTRVARDLRFRSQVSVPMLRDGEPVGAIAVGRYAPGPFSDAQIELLKTFADQAVIAIENARLFTELQEKNRALTEAHARVTEALEQRTATAEILGVISSSPTSVEPVFGAVSTSAARLCDAQYAGVMLVRDGQLVIQLGDDYVIPPAQQEFLTRLERIPITRDLAVGRAVLEGTVQHIHDVLAMASAGQVPMQIQSALGYRTFLAVPMLREGTAIGVIVAWRSEVRPFTATQIELVKTFADQAVIAIENVRLFAELEQKNRAVTEALEQQTATSDILRVISSSPTDVQPVFKAILQAAVRLCEARFGGVFRFDGELVHFVTAHEWPAEHVEIVRRHFPMPPGDGSLVARAIRDRRIVQVHDYTTEPTLPRWAIENERGLGAGGTIALPLLLAGHGGPVGGIVLARAGPGEFPDNQVALLQTFADQAVIAIENVRLFTELQEKNRAITEALEQQTATAEILRVISRSPTDVQPVFDAIVRSATPLCAGSLGGLIRVDGETLRLAASHNAGPAELNALSEVYPMPLASPTAFATSIRERATFHSRDMATDPRISVAGQTRWAELGLHSLLFVPLYRGEAPIGAIGIAREAPGGFGEPQIALLKTFADQAVIAIENVRLFTELQERTRELGRTVQELEALGEVSRSVTSTLDVDTVLQTIVSRASQLAGADGCSIFRYDEDTETFALSATHGPTGEFREAQRAATIRRGQGVVGRLPDARDAIQVADIALEHAYHSPLRDMLLEGGYRAVLAVPLVREDRVVGGLVVSRKEPGEFPRPTIELLKRFATQSSLALWNASLYRELDDKSRELEVANRHKSEFLASMSHELRTPLNAVIGFSEVLIAKMFGDLNDKQEEYLRDIYASGRHLLSLINDILDLAKIEAGRLELELTRFDLPQAIDNALTLVRGRADTHAIRLDVEVDRRLGDFVGDERKFKQILLNLLSNAVKFTPEGGRVSVRATLVNGSVEVAVADTGIGIAPEDQQAVFEEFRQVGTDYARKREGTGLGLALTRRFVELHGGSIWLKSGPGEGSTFTFTLPVGPWPAS